MPEREEMKRMRGECGKCGFNFETPAGENDAVSTLQHHYERMHKQEYPQGISREEALRHIREAE
jgi:hypothetical protein